MIFNPVGPEQSMQPETVIAGLVTTYHPDRLLQVLLRLTAVADNERLPARGREHASSAAVSPPAMPSQLIFSATGEWIPTSQRLLLNSSATNIVAVCSSTADVLVTHEISMRQSPKE